MHCQCGRKPPKLPLPLGLGHPAGGKPSQGYRQHAQKIGKDRACGSRDILTARQTDRQTDTHTHTDVLITILCTAPAGEVTRIIQQVPAAIISH